MKKSILISSSILFLLCGFPLIPFAQDAVGTEEYYAFEKVNYDCQIPIVKEIILSEEKEAFEAMKQHRKFATNLRFIRLKRLSGEVPNTFKKLVQEEVSMLSKTLDYQYSLAHTKVNVKLSFNNNGKVAKVIVDGDKLDEHFIKALEDALLSWQLDNSTAVKMLTVRLDLLLS